VTSDTPEIRAQSGWGGWGYVKTDNLTINTANGENGYGKGFLTFNESIAVIIVLVTVVGGGYFLFAYARKKWRRLVLNAMENQA